MKTLKYILLSLVACLAFSSCSNEDESVNYKPEASPFSVQVNGNTTTPATATAVTVAISAGTDGWWVGIPEGSWCSFSATKPSYTVYGSGDRSLTIYVSANATGATRTQTVTFHPTFGLDPVTVIITQGN
jgi:hypothetical protein